MIAQNLPPQLTPFVGRNGEMAEIMRLLADPACRLLTLVGPGGIGKTRLAIEAARLIDSPRPEGEGPGVRVYFVPLQALSSPDFMVPAIAEALQFHFYPGGDPKQQLLDHLREKALLLLLDNFEHLLDGVELLPEMLEHAPGVKLLVTSRERLRLREEWVFDVRGLPFPENGHPAAWDDYAAVQLFVQHARRAGYTPVDADTASIGRICQLVGGMPLALELAAAWVRAMPCGAIAREIEHSLDILTTTTRNMPEKHRSMRAAFEHSWHLLTDEEQAVFRKLSVFRGGFTREAAEQVAGATLHILSALVDKSLLRVDANGRYDLHELLRQYAESQLDEISAREARNAHCAHYAGFLFRRVADLKGRRQLDALAEIHEDFENVRAAWYWAVEHHRVALIKQMIEGLWIFCELANRELEGYALFRYAEQRYTSTSDDGTESLWRRLLARAAIGEGLEVELEKALHLAQSLNDPVEVAFCLARLGKAAHRNGENRRAKQLLLDSLTIYRQFDDNYAASSVLYWLLTTSFGENWEEFRGYGEEALRRSSAIGDQFGIVRSLVVAALDAGRSGRFEEAESLWFKRIALGKEINNLEMIGGSYLILSDRVYFFQGKFEQARAAAEESIRIGNNLGLPQANALIALGIIASASGDYEAGIRLCKQGAALGWDPDTTQKAAWGIAIASCGLGDYATAQDSLLTAYPYLAMMVGQVGLVATLPIIATILAHRGNHIRAVELLALAFTHPIRASGWMEKWALLDRLRAELEGELGSEVYAAAWERGSHLNLEVTVDQFLRQFRSGADDPAAHANQALIEPLTERQLEILQLIADGLSNREIADQLFLAVNTVKYYNYQIFSKLYVANRTQAVARARELGLLT